VHVNEDEILKIFALMLGWFIKLDMEEDNNEANL
jgi:hypothetical protein